MVKIISNINTVLLILFRIGLFGVGHVWGGA